ncbi:MAG: type I-C CRISPR-associated endonuclease Cas1c [Oscillospiraceae bacterium]|jgi:CRISPR-associated protein Cas1|nr:type I-C CRISPR-associated endonuclease Cas1c [Oscillospiraceae bacterium]
MKKLLNVLYVTQPDCYLALENETVCVRKEEQTLLRLPLLNLEGIVTFGRTGASPALMGECARRGVDLVFLTEHGRFLARVAGESHGNVTLRREQYRAADNLARSCGLGAHFLLGKLFNSKWVLERAAREYPQRVDAQALKAASAQIGEAAARLPLCQTPEQLRGEEGGAATTYFRVFDEMILNQKETFHFNGRNRRPPTDPVNALLSFGYTLLARECAAALEGVGLDAYVGFLHRDRPGRISLALDLMEELRAVMVDRVVLAMINRRELSAKDFITQESGAVLLKDDSRKAFLAAWQGRKQESITHPYLEEKLLWGLVPHAQALLLARHLRGDLEAYPPFLWK